MAVFSVARLLLHFAGNDGRHEGAHLETNEEMHMFPVMPADQVENKRVLLPLHWFQTAGATSRASHQTWKDIIREWDIDFIDWAVLFNE